jgi:hypothetical protein
VRVDEFVFSAQSVGRIALALHTALRNHTIALYDDDDLLTELARVRLEERGPGQYRLDHAHGEHDDRAVALAMCVAELGRTRSIAPWAPCLQKTMRAKRGLLEDGGAELGGERRLPRASSLPIRQAEVVSSGPPFDLEAVRQRGRRALDAREAK